MDGGGSPEPGTGARRPPPEGFTWRRPTWDDLDAVAALFAACSLDRVGAVTVRRDDLRVRWLELGGFEDALLVERPEPGATVERPEPGATVERPEAQPRLVAYAELFTDVDPLTDELDLHSESWIHPDWTGHGLATFLLARAEDAARRAGAARGEREMVLATSVVDGDEAARAFVADRGFVAVRHLLTLHLDLHADPPSPVWPTGVTCRRFEPARDERSVWEAHQRAFADVPTHLPLTFEEFDTDRLAGQSAFDPALTLLAEHRADPTARPELIGVLLGRAGAPQAAEQGWVRDLGVVPAWRRHGVGMALLRAGFAAFRARGLSSVGLEVDDVTLEGAVALYRRAGMRITRRTDVLEATLRVDVLEATLAVDAG